MQNMTQSNPSDAPKPLDISEKGAPVGGTPQLSEKRLFFQLQVYGQCGDPRLIVEELKKMPIEAVLYLDVNDPQGVGILIITEDPNVFTQQARCLFASSVFSSLRHKPEFTMLGRTYSTGREPDLEDWLLHKPRRNALNTKWPWAVWYPLRRKPEFALLSREEQGKILAEHGTIGRSYGQAGVAADIRLACHGLDRNDNEFVLGLVGPELFPLSRLVQEMRKTQQTARYMQAMGPFFVGRTLWQSPLA